jgi:hypothetical protein
MRRRGDLAALVLRDDPLRERIDRMPANDATFWAMAAKALAHGGRFRRDSASGERQFCAPWAEHALLDFGETPQELLGPEGLLPAVVMEPTTIYEADAPSGAAVAQVQTGYLRVVLETTPGERFVYVDLAGEKRGKVARSSVWTVWESPVCFAQRNGGWRLVAMGPE